MAKFWEGVEFNDPLWKALRKYEKRFPRGFPATPLMRGRTDEEVIAIIEECLEKGKDVEELGYYKDPKGEFLY